MKDDDWVNVMKEDLGKIEKNKTWTFVPIPIDKNVISTKWIFRNKERLVCKGYEQEEGLDYGDIFPLFPNLKMLEYF